MSERARWLGLLAGVLAVKALGILLDPTPKFLLGDSATFLQVLLDGTLPVDRSFLYGYLVAALSLPCLSLHGVVVGQSLIGAGTAMAGALIARRTLRCSFGASAATALLLALDPYQLLHERMILAETGTLALLALMLLAAAAYLERPRLLPLLLMSLAATLMVSFRVSMLLAAWWAAAAVPILAAWRSGLRARLLALHLVASLGAAAATQLAYAELFGWATRTPPAFVHQDGLFLAGAVAPLLQPQDGVRDDIRALIARGAEYDLGDRRRRNRQLWSPEGFCARLRQLYPDVVVANRLARQTARRAIERDPLGLAGLALATYADFWRIHYARAELGSELGDDRPLDASLVARLAARGLPLALDRYRREGGELYQPRSVTKRLYALGAWPYGLVLLHSPLLLLVLGLASRRRGQGALILMAGLGAVQVVVLCAFSPKAIFRYLLPLSLPALCGLAVLIDVVRQRGRATD